VGKRQGNVVPSPTFPKDNQQALGETEEREEKMQEVRKEDTQYIGVSAVGVQVSEDLNDNRERI
jgi:hypothetical protein